MTLAIPTDDAAFVARMVRAGHAARRLAFGDPETPVRREAKAVSVAFLELMKAHGSLERAFTEREQVPEEKTCAGCKRCLPITQFSLFRKKRPDGSTYSYPRSACKECVAEMERKRYNARPKRVKPPKVVKPKLAWLTGKPEEIAEAVVDAAMERRVRLVSVDGSLALLKAADPVPVEAEIVGTYDAGADYRLVLEDIAA